MAVISRIRKHSGWLVALIGLSIAGFILQDAFSGSGGGRRIPKFAVINGEEIKIQQFEERVEQVSENFRLQQGGMQLSPEDLFQIREHVWMTMVGDILLNHSMKRLGLTVTTREMNDMFYGQFIHHQVHRAFADPATGMLNRQQVLMFINNFDQYPVETQMQFRDLELMIREERQKSKFYNIIASAYHVPSFYVNYMYEQANSSAAATVASLSYMDIPDQDITLSEADFKAYFNKHKPFFRRTEATRAIDFVVFDVIPTEEDMLALERHAHVLFEEFMVEQDLPNFINAVSTERFDSIYLAREAFSYPWDSLLFRSPKGTFFKPELRRGRFEMAKLIDVATRPDSLRASHILIAFRNPMTGQTRTKERAKSIADSLRTVVLRDRFRFAELAQTYGEDATREMGGDLGWFLDGQMIRSFNEAVVKGNIGDIVVVETVHGFHVVEITGKSRPIQKVMAAFVYVPIEPSAQTNKAVYTEVNHFFARSQNLESFLAAAREANLRVRSADDVTEMDMTLPGLQNARDIVRWAYDRRTRAGQVSPEIHEYENKYVVAALRQIRAKGYPTLAEIMNIPEIQHAVLNERKAEILIEKMNGAFKTNRTIAALESVNAEVETVDHLSFNAYGFGSRGFEPEVVGTIFGTKESRVSNPIQGRSGVFVVEPTNFTPAEPLDDVNVIRMQMQMMFQRGMVEAIRRAKEERAKIIDNRAFYF
ncbi:MAG: SurA N-terminal domain-containing protein [Bacteroidales bacterium]|nr:SurA N-terminal domain-containing protein [Bacteroidales bacterium]